MNPGDRADVDAFMAKLRADEAAEALADAVAAERKATIRASAPDVRSMSPEDYAKAEAKFLQAAESNFQTPAYPQRSAPPPQPNQSGRLKHLSEMTPEEFRWAQSKFLAEAEVIELNRMRGRTR